MTESEIYLGFYSQWRARFLETSNNFRVIFRDYEVIYSANVCKVTATHALTCLFIRNT